MDNNLVFSTFAAGANYAESFNSFLLSKNLRRLKGKKQVFSMLKRDSSVKCDYIHERLNHSLEVASIANEIAEKICESTFTCIINNKEEEISIEISKNLLFAIAVGHDFGHTPFGHVGETAISDYLQGKNRGSFFVQSDDSKTAKRRPLFKHNFYSSIILCRDFANCSPDIIDGVLKHTSTNRLNGVDIDNRAFGTHVYFPISLKKDTNYLKNSCAYTLEGQIIKAADDIAQILSDIEDSDIVLQKSFVEDSLDYEDLIFDKEKVTLKEYLTKTRRAFISKMAENSVSLLKQYLSDYSDEIFGMSESEQSIKLHRQVIKFDDETQKMFKHLEDRRDGSLHSEEKIQIQNFIAYLVVYKIFNSIENDPYSIKQISFKNYSKVIDGFVDIRNRYITANVQNAIHLKKMEESLGEEYEHFNKSLHRLIKGNGDKKISPFKINNQNEVKYLFEIVAKYYREKFSNSIILDNLSECLFREMAFSIAKMTDKFAIDLFFSKFSKEAFFEEISSYVRSSKENITDCKQFNISKIDVDLVINRLKELKSC